MDQMNALQISEFFATIKEKTQAFSNVNPVHKNNFKFMTKILIKNQ